MAGFAPVSASVPRAGTAAAAAERAGSANITARWLISRTAIELIDGYTGSDKLTTSAFDGPSTAETNGLEPQWTSQRTASFDAYGSASTPRSFLYAIATGTVPPGTTYVLYDNEDWAMTPAAERADPGTYMAQFVDTAHAYGYKAILAPSPDITTDMSCHNPAEASWANYLTACDIPALVAAAHPDVFEIQAQPYEAVTSTNRNCGCYQWLVTDAVAEAKAQAHLPEVLAGLSTNPEGATIAATTLYADTLHTEGAVSGYWLNVPERSAACPSCAVGGDPQVAAQYLALRGYGQSAHRTPPPPAYWLAARDGQVFAAGTARALGGTTVPAADPVVGIAATSDGGGYWVVTASGTIRSFGDALYRGDLPGIGVHVSDIVAIAPTGDGRGYWLIGRDGGEFAFGDARYHGSLPGIGVHVFDVVGMVATSDGGGYWLVGTDGGVFAFGNAKYKGSLPGLGVHVSDVRAMIASPTRGGYILVGADGGTFVFGGGVHYLGSLPGRGIRVDDIAGLALTPGAAGYWLAGANGAVYSFGNAHSLATPASVSRNLPIAAIAGT